MQKADFEIDDRRTAAHQALGLHYERIAAGSDGKIAWKDLASGPALPVFDRRRTVGIKNEPLVKHRPGDGLSFGGIHHDASASPAGNRLCGASSRRANRLWPRLRENSSKAPRPRLRRTVSG